MTPSSLDRQTRDAETRVPRDAKKQQPEDAKTPKPKNAKSPKIRVLSIPSETLYAAWHGGFDRDLKSGIATLPYNTYFYGIKGALEMAPVELVWDFTKFEELWFEREDEMSHPPGHLPMPLGDLPEWRNGVTQLAYRWRTRDGTPFHQSNNWAQRYSALEFLRHFEANSEQYAYRPGTKPDSTPRYRYNPNNTAIHITCAVDLFDPPTPTLGPGGTKQDGAPSRTLTQPPGLATFLSVWEPQLGRLEYGPEILVKFKSACGNFDVIATTHTVLEKMFGMSYNVFPSNKRERLLQCSKVTRHRILAAVKELFVAGVGRNGQGIVVVRAGKLGNLAVKGRGRGKKGVKHEWLHGFRHERVGSLELTATRDKKVSPAAGTMFVGGLTYALARGENYVEAVDSAATMVNFHQYFVNYERL